MIDKRKAKETPENKALVLASLSYDPVTGEFRWKATRKNGAQAGTIAGCLHRSGYMLISVSRIKFPSHRLAWLFHTGEWPKDHIDHINGGKSDNRICNLREATQSQNLFNSRKPICNTSGFKGVSWYERSNKYRALITVRGARHYLGLFDDPATAHEAYKSASIRLHGEFYRPDSDACLDKVKELNQ
jgi:hypothetical protein